MPAIHASSFDAIVAGFYRAATGDIAWGNALRQVQQAFGARLVVLHTMNMAREGRLVVLSYSDGEPRAPEAVLHYVRDWHLRDPRRNRFLADGPAAIGQWRHCHDAFDDRFVQADPFFREYLAGYDTRYNANVVPPVEAGIVSTFVFELPATRGPLDADERVDAERLGRHLQDALRAHERVRRMATTALAGHRLLEDFGFPVWLLDADRFAWHANAAARLAQADGKLLVLRDDRLQAVHDRADRGLTAQLQVLQARGHGARGRVDLRRHAAEPPALLLLHAMAPSQALGAIGERPVVMATLVQSQTMRALDPVLLAGAFEMTPAQGRVAALLADGLSAPEIAGRLGCALSTVRSHLRAVLRALGARRLVDAVRLLRQGDALWARAADLP